MALFDKEPLLGALGKESFKDSTYNGRTWEEVEDRELEMISGMDCFLEKASQKLTAKSKKIFKEWQANE
jgi:hypothetical protein